MAHPLDNVVWSALTSVHAPLARGGALARRYPPEIARFVALGDDSPAARAELAGIVAPGEEVALVTLGEVDAGDAFEVLARKQLVQMIAPGFGGAPRDATRFEPLGDADIPQMLALAEATKPGPFQQRTLDFGGFLGHKVDGRLVAMGGRRLHLDAFTEVSGICTDPGHRGQGFARDLVLILSAGIAAEGRTPFLHAYADNTGAISLYERLGFHVRVRPDVVLVRRR